MAADMYFQNPLYRAFFYLTGVCRANKGKGLDVSLKRSREILHSGGTFLIFPFGKRVYDSNYPRPGRGAATLIKNFSNLTVLPVFLKTTPSPSLFDSLFHRKEIGVIIGTPFIFKDAGEKEVDVISLILAEKIVLLDHSLGGQVACNEI